MLKNSARAYPSYIVFGEDDWMDIQKDVEANLALSPEETDVLESVHSRQGGFPIFINGRAGSGKSTILYYLFADYVNLYLELQGQHESTKAPLLLSCSHEPAPVRRERSLISSSPTSLAARTAAEAPSDCFQEFQTFLHALLPEDERAAASTRLSTLTSPVSDECGSRILRRTNGYGAWALICLGMSSGPL